jgi:hydrogenase nickel incorporation protein HypA/HybF
MHELSIAQNILDIVNEELLSNNLSKATKVTVRVGRLAGIEPASLRFCFEILTRDTKAEGSALEIDYVPVRFKCHACQIDFALDRWDFICPECMGNRLEITSGRELQVVELEAY